MRDFNEQRKSFWKGFILFIILFAYLIMLFFGVLIKFTNDFTLIKVFNAENSTSAFAKDSLVVSQYVKPTQGSKVLYKVNINNINHMVYSELVKQEENVYTFLDAEGKEYTETLTIKQIYGKPLMVIPTIGSFLKILQSNNGLIIIIGATVFVVLVISLYLIIANLRKNNQYSDGINFKKFNPEDAFIYTKLSSWLKKCGFDLKSGPNCDFILLRSNNKKRTNEPNIFGAITFENGSIYVKINYDFDNGKFYTRAGYIRIEKAINLPDAKKQIKEYYYNYFAKPKRQP